MADMASVDAPRGFTPYGEMMGCNMYAIQTTPTTAIYHGDVATKAGNTLLTPHMGNIQEVVVAATGAAGVGLGIIIGIYDEDMQPVESMATTDAGDGTIAGYVLVADSGYQRYVAQEDGVTSSLQAADIGLNIQAITTHAGSDGISGMELDSNTAAATVAHMFKLIAVHPEDTLSVSGTAGNHCRFIVMLNNAGLSPNVVGV